ncbi:hypothetical protein LBMAG39_00280 [Cyanobium sp.]|nr:hypothetical protein LBMAG39_00280 [Cyanobium sp.]
MEGDIGILTSQRLSDQLLAMSAVAEMLTIRLLELEERCQRWQQGLDHGATHDSSVHDSILEGLDQTQTRLAQLEALLHPTQQPFEPDGLVAEPVAAEDDEEDHPELHGEPDGQPWIDSSFAEEGEQMFMDETQAA